MGAHGLPEGSAWVDQIAREELQREFNGFGPDVRALVGCMPEKTLRWYMHVVHPPLESYSNGRVAVLGDAVRAYSLPSRLLAFAPKISGGSSGALTRIILHSLPRPMVCCPTWERELDKGSKMLCCWCASSVIPRPIWATSR